MNSKSNNNKQSQVYVANNKQCCKVCKDAGKPEAAYSNHYVKDKSGRVTCPTLLSQQCRYCFKSGHTVKFCTILKEKQEQEKNPTNNTRQISKPVAPKKKEVKKSNVFAYLDINSDDSDSETESAEVEEFPTLSAVKAATTSVQMTNPNSYASILSKPKPQVEQDIKQKIVVLPIVIKKMEKISWVDAESSDEEESDDEEDEIAVITPLLIDSKCEEYEDNSAW